MRRQHRTKIVATLGPATSTAETIAALFEAGVDVFRLNFSHGTQEDHRKNYEIIRELEYTTGRPIAVLMDLQGPKLRIGTFADGHVTLKNGAPFRLDQDPAAGDGTRVCLPHPEIYQAIEQGTNLLLDDGRIRLEVETCGDDFAECRVVTGGELSNRKGVNVPGVVLPLSPLTRKDQDDLRFGLQCYSLIVQLSGLKLKVRSSMQILLVILSEEI